MGVFEMKGNGLEEVANPSEVFPRSIWYFRCGINGGDEAKLPVLGIREG